MMDIAVVTSAWGDYGKYLPRWANSVCRQEALPRQAAILDAGITDMLPMCQAVDTLHDAGIEVLIQRESFTSMGAARNAAVGLTDAEWVMHLDADDTLIPHALGDVDAVHDGFDVVSVGALHRGRERVYPRVSARGILSGQHGMFSCGAFRRLFWTIRPWHTENEWVDSVFWVGLAHLGAKFTSTSRPGFIYHDHPDSVSHRLSPEDRRAAQQQWAAACREWNLT